MATPKATFVNYTASNSLKAWYHLWDTGTGGVLYYFGGDYSTLTNAAINYPTSGALAKLSEVAKAKNLMLVAVNSPDTDATTNGYTWWESLPANGVFFRDLHAQLVKDNPTVDASNLWFAGFSGGAEFIAYEIFYRGMPGFKTGGGVIVGGGGAFTPAVTTPWQGAKDGAALYWFVGDQDIAGATSPADWSAYDTATKAVSAYKTAGFNATLRVLPGLNHDKYDTSAYVSEVVPVATPPVAPPPVIGPPEVAVPEQPESVGAVTTIRGLRTDGRLPRPAVGHVDALISTGGSTPTARRTLTQTRDITDDLRAALDALGGKAGVVKIPAGQFYLGGGSTGKPLVLASGQRIEGAGVANSATVLWVDDKTKGMAQIITSTSTTGVGVTALTFENRCTSLDDTSFRDPVYLRGAFAFELSYDTRSTTGVGFQFDVNIKANPDTPSAGFPRDGWVHDCSFTALTEFHQCHNLLVERCTWDLDRALKRPAWLRGANQTGFKFSGSWGVVEDCTMRDCTMYVHGTGEKIEPFELIRAQRVKLERFRYRGDRPDTPAQIDMASTKAEHGVVEGQMEAALVDCEFNEMQVAVYENVDVSMRGCVWRNRAGGTWNAVMDANGTRAAQATVQYPTRITLDGCRLLGGGRVFIATNTQPGEYRIQNTIIEYDRAVYTLGVNIAGTNKRVVMSNTRVVLKNLAGGSPSVVYLGGVQYAHLGDLEVVTNPGVAPTSPVVWLAKGGLISTGTFVQPKAMTSKVNKESTFSGTVTESGPLVPA